MGPQECEPGGSSLPSYAVSGAGTNRGTPSANAAGAGVVKLFQTAVIATATSFNVSPSFFQSNLPRAARFSSAIGSFHSPEKAELQRLKVRLNPFALAAQVERELKAIEAIRCGRET